MALTELDRERLRQALALARGSFGLTDPNPRVGCVLGHEDGRVLGAGATQAAGSAHAEVMALRSARAAGHTLVGATAWVTLEPCAHQGRTPPCCDALIEAGLARCVVALADPYPAVAGQGLARMRAAGLQVQLVDDADIVAAAREINIGFFSRIERGRPWVRVKAAASADGKLGLPDGRSKWITGEAARADGHAWRRRASAVLTGIGTVLADNPRLDVRAVTTARQPWRVVLDTTARTPTDAALFEPEGGVLVVAAAGPPVRVAALRARGAEVWDGEPARSAVELLSLLQRLAARGINELHVEAGPQVTGSLLQAGLVDEFVLYLAPIFLGPGLPLIHMAALQELAQAQRFVWSEATALGDDLRLRLMSKGAGAWGTEPAAVSAGFTPGAQPASRNVG